MTLKLAGVCFVTLMVGGASALAGAESPAPKAPTFVPLSSGQAWSRLPRAEQGTQQPLPVWARALAETLPRTTAAMLELDYEHRAGGPLPLSLRARIRGVVAHANRCAYGAACAAADLARACRTTALRPAGRTPLALTEAERAALAFAERLTLAADSITDAEVARLVGWYGDQQVVAMVLLVAYANFLDRLVLALDLPADDGALAPLEVRFAPLPLGADRTAPPRPAPAQTVRVPDLAPDPEWLALDFRHLQQEIAQQRCRRPRVALPASQPVATVYWGLACRTYQPRLADRWAACKLAFGAEANQDPVFEASLFWVVTRTQRSFY